MSMRWRTVFCVTACTRTNRVAYTAVCRSPCEGVLFGYALYVPSGYQPATAYPLVLCLHGAGFTGEAYLDRWQSRLNEQYILACPTMPMGNWWTRDAADVVLATLRDVQRLATISIPIESFSPACPTAA